MNVSKAKRDVYLAADRVLVEAGKQSCNEIEAFVEKKRVELKQRFAER